MARPALAGLGRPAWSRSMASMLGQHLGQERRRFGPAHVDVDQHLLVGRPEFRRILGIEQVEDVEALLVMAQELGLDPGLHPTLDLAQVVEVDLQGEQAVALGRALLLAEADIAHQGRGRVAEDDHVVGVVQVVVVVDPAGQNPLAMDLQKPSHTRDVPSKFLRPAGLRSTRVCRNRNVMTLRC